jgi:hypothetical protein
MPKQKSTVKPTVFGPARTHSLAIRTRSLDWHPYGVAGLGGCRHTHKTAAWAGVGVQSSGKGLSRWKHRILPGKRGQVPWTYCPCRCRIPRILRGHSWANWSQASS